jgi:hypothetical protein
MNGTGRLEKARSASAFSFRPVAAFATFRTPQIYARRAEKINHFAEADPDFLPAGHATFATPATGPQTAGTMGGKGRGKGRRTNQAMRDAQHTLEQYFLEMRWRCLSLAADLDRVERADGGPALIDADPRLQKLRQALGVLLEGRGNRAEQVQNIFSDKTPPPAK